jgi:lipid-binding SYLF domain-containing protein
MRIIRLIFIFLSFLSLFIPMMTPAAVQEQSPKPAQAGRSPKLNETARAAARAAAASQMFREIVEPPASIPIYILTVVKAIAVISSRPDFGDLNDGEDGVGLVVARDPQSGQWSAPIYLTLKGGKIQGGPLTRNLADLLKGKKTDLILLAMNQHAANQFLTGQVVVLGEDVLVVSGSFGEVAKPGMVTAAISSGIVSYLYHRTGEIIGATITESKLRQDQALNNALYEQKVIDTYFPPNKTMPNDILVLSSTMNQFNKLFGRY